MFGLVRFLVSVNFIRLKQRGLTSYMNMTAIKVANDSSVKRVM
jgi:hypothetical protein